MYKDKCNKCGKEIDVPSKSDDEDKATGLFCECMNRPLCFRCNAENVDSDDKFHNSACAFGFPKEGDWFYPKEDVRRLKER